MRTSLIVASALAAAAAPAFKAEKCYGVAAAGQNDCQTATHSCAGEVPQGGRSRFLDLRAGGYLFQNQRRQPRREVTVWAWAGE